MDAFEGTSWILASGIPFPQDVPIARPSASFDAGTVSGFAGCNRYSGGYTVDGPTLTLGPLISTLMACARPADRIERDYLAALEAVAGWRLDAGELTLVDGEGVAVLSFVVTTPTGSWQLTALTHGGGIASPIEGSEVDATFAADGTLSGSSGCNRYRGSYTVESGSMTISPMAVTRMLCIRPEGVMEQEAAYLAALGSAARFRLDGTLLELIDARDVRLATFLRTA